MLKSLSKDDKEANDFITELIKEHNKRKESDDYNVDIITPRLRMYGNGKNNYK